MVLFTPEWKTQLRRYSVQALAVVTTIQGAWVMLPMEIKAHVPDWIVTSISCLIAAAGLIGAFMNQRGLTSVEPTNK